MNMINEPTETVVIRFPLKEPYITYGLIGVLALVHLYVMQLSPRETQDFYIRYGNFSTFVAQGEYYRLFTSMFLHAGLYHLLFNGFALYAFGRDIEGLFGHGRFLLIYVLGGLAGSVASFVITSGNSIGASGAVFAIFGALVAYYYQNRALYGAAAYQRLRQLGTLAVLNLVIGLISNVPGSPARIDNAAHIGGAVGGLLLAWFMTPVFILKADYQDGEIRHQLTDTKTTLAWLWVPLVFTVGLVAVVAFWG